MPAVAHLTLDLVRTAAREVAETYALDLVVLFGSAAREGFAAAGDVDLAVIGGTASDDGWAYGAEAGLSSEFARRLDTAAVDLVGADRASALLQAHIARDGVPVYERRPGAFAEFRAAAERRFEDAWPRYEAEWEETKRLIRVFLPPEPDYRPWGEPG